MLARVRDRGRGGNELELCRSANGCAVGFRERSADPLGGRCLCGAIPAPGRAQDRCARAAGRIPVLVDRTDAAQAAQHAGHLRAEDAAVGVRLVDDDITEVAEEFGPQRVVGQDARVEHVGIGQQDARLLAEPGAAALGRVAVVGRGQRIDDSRARGIDQGAPFAELVLGQRLGRVEIKRACQGIARQRLQHGHVERQGLARCG